MAPKRSNNLSTHGGKTVCGGGGKKNPDPTLYYTQKLIPGDSFILNCERTAKFPEGKAEEYHNLGIEKNFLNKILNF